MPRESKPTRATVAAGFEEAAARAIDGLTGVHAHRLTATEAITLAQVQATLALGQRVADLTETLHTGLDEVRAEIGRGLGA